MPCSAITVSAISATLRIRGAEAVGGEPSGAGGGGGGGVSIRSSSSQERSRLVASRRAEASCSRPSASLSWLRTSSASAAAAAASVETVAAGSGICAKGSTYSPSYESPSTCSSRARSMPAKSGAGAVGERCAKSAA